mmetsp:Transcript_7538/g.7609  ORF Transcript_7538/g.7609 Transcript_7538/m.7609 type:complete len:372 (+) Transcript_7538:120-1235(+)|eukprot:CAMPEP_0119053450 /NCGR_PEP_ID=MMETSP1177-20130426/74434_1 /TAXON_ID=2985 /ORGANISM="Ochromonas sp, Strain CCMP1899" /LENGTH=371 /DNA_ID=CAMNT_0007033407 /DNA_START=64 /DNA_END=1179 /DNA_ORIENTATION=+
MGGGISRRNSFQKGKTQEVADNVLKYRQIDLNSKFKEFDLENSGYIGTDQFTKLIEWILDMNEMPQDEKASDRYKDVTLLKILGRGDLAQGDRLNLSSFIMLVETEFEIVFMLNKSRMKFKELDVNISGALLHKEICLLSEFCLNLDKVTESDKERIMLNIEQRHTTFDAGLSFEEFFVLYEEERRVQTNIVFATRKFKELDEDRSGYLGCAELNEVVEWILDNGQKYNNSNKIIKNMTKIEMMKKIDANGDGQLSLEEFCQLYENEMKSIEIRNRGKMKFFELDVDHNGYLENDELNCLFEYLLKTLKMPIGSKEQMKVKAMDRIDANSDGKISWNEFLIFFEQVTIEAKATNANDQTEVLTAANEQTEV